jgi:methyltransferase family protein
MIPTLERISPRYLAMQKQLHADPRGYGGRGDKWAGILLQVAIEHGCTSILDYGCGQGTLATALRQLPLGAIRVDEYDPAISGKDVPPDFADLVNVTDVLEHIEPDRLDAVLRHLRMLARKAIFVVVSTKRSNKILADGRNAHILIKPGWWWKRTFVKAGFTLRNAPTAARREPAKEWVVVLQP